MKKHILVVDDDTLLTTMIGRCLQENGYTVTTANNGEEAISFLEGHRIDVVLCDIHMNGTEGFAVLAASKIMHPTTKVILCSADIEYKTISLAFKCGADSFLAKPFLVRELHHQVERCFARNQADSERPLPHAVAPQLCASGGYPD